MKTSGACVYCGTPSTMRVRASAVQVLPGPLGWLAALLAMGRARWAWTCDRHTVEELHRALRGPGGQQ